MVVKHGDLVEISLLAFLFDQCCCLSKGNTGEGPRRVREAGTTSPSLSAAQPSGSQAGRPLGVTSSDWLRLA